MNKNPDRGRSWGDAVAIQWAAKAFKMKINVWDEGSVATPPISACFDYSGDIMYRVIDMAHITMNGMVEHYEPIVPSPIAPAVHTVPHSCPNAKPHTNMKATQLVTPILQAKPYMRPPFPSPTVPFISAKLAQPSKPFMPVTPTMPVVRSQPAPCDRHPNETQRRLTTNEVSMLMEVIKGCHANEKFRILKSVERVKAVFGACPPSLQPKLNHTKIKNHINTFIGTQKDLLKVQEMSSHVAVPTAGANDISEPEDGGSEEDGCRMSDSDELPSKGLTLEEAERQFKSKIRDWPVYTCSSCHEMHRASTLKPPTDLDRIPDDAQATFIASNAPHAQYHVNNWLLCTLCRKYWGLGKIPPQSAFNEVSLSCLLSLLICMDEMGERLCALHTPFMTMKQLPAGGQMSLTGAVINVDNDIDRVQTALLPLMKEGAHGMVLVEFKRMLKFKTSSRSTLYCRVYAAG